METFKYEAAVYINANTDKVEFIGDVRANSLKELKEKARYHARSWNKHLFGRLTLTFTERDDININP